MSGPLFEQYKAALRRGHLAALGGALDDALEAYREAARLAPDRPLPFASQGTVLHRLGRWPDAAEAFDRALRVAPDDEATLRARGTAAEARGMRSSAAADFERLAFVLDVAGRSEEAVEVARKASALDPSAARHELITRLEQAVARSSRPARGADAGTTDGAAPDVAVRDEETPVAADGVDWPHADSPSPAPPAVVGAPPDPEQLMADAASAIEGGDLRAARDLMLSAVLVHRSAGHLDAALDACLELLAAAPGDPQVHLALANLQLDHGWTGLATEKIDLLVRLTSLTGDTQAEADAHGLAAERLRDGPATVAGSAP